MFIVMFIVMFRTVTKLRYKVSWYWNRNIEVKTIILTHMFIYDIELVRVGWVRIG